MFKPLEFANPEPDINYEQALPLYASLGHAVARWGLLELSLANWFGALTGMKPQMANDVFHSQQSFKGRLAITEAALENSTVSEDAKLFIAAVIGKLKSYTSFRNSMVHGCALIVYKTDGYAGSKIFAMYGPLTDERTADAITIEHLDQAARNFNALLRPMDDALVFNRGVKLHHTRGPTPTWKELQQQVELLPNVASSHEISQTQRGRMRQAQAAARTPKPKKNSGKAP